MPAEFDVGFSVREPAWHGLATVLQDYPGRKEAMEIAGHNWYVNEEEIYVLDGQDYSGMDRHKMIHGFKALTRSDDDSVLSVVRDSYTVVQNNLLWDIVDLVVQQDNVKYETAGVLRKGTVLWVLAKLDEPVQINGDNSLTFPYVCVSTSHDGSQPCRATSTSIRVICANTFDMSMEQTSRAGTQFTFRHTKNVNASIDDARSALGLTRHLFEEFIEMANDLATHRVSRDGVTDFLAQFVPMPHADVITDRVKKNIESERQKIREIVQLSPTIAPEHRQSSYGLWCAGVEYMDHMRRYNTKESYFRRTMFDFSKAKSKLAKLAVKVAV